MSESFHQFHARCEERSGVPFNQIPSGESDDLLDGTILCRWHNIYLITSGNPDYQDEDNVEYWDAIPSNFRIVQM